MMGVRADITSQAARIDAHSLREDGVTRLCYAGTVVHANPLGTLETRVPIKAGAELFGDASIAADGQYRRGERTDRTDRTAHQQ